MLDKTVSAIRKTSNCTHMKCLVTEVHEERDIVLFDGPQNFEWLTSHC